MSNIFVNNQKHFTCSTLLFHVSSVIALLSLLNKQLLLYYITYAFRRIYLFCSSCQSLFKLHNASIFLSVHYIHFMALSLPASQHGTAISPKQSQINKTTVQTGEELYVLFLPNSADSPPPVFLQNRFILLVPLAHIC